METETVQLFEEAQDGNDHEVAPEVELVSVVPPSGVRSLPKTP